MTRKMQKKPDSIAVWRGVAAVQRSPKKNFGRVLDG
jgi:hypothetical protein